MDKYLQIKAFVDCWSEQGRKGVKLNSPDTLKGIYVIVEEPGKSPESRELSEVAIAFRKKRKSMINWATM